jgi:hypothetical protein
VVVVVDDEVVVGGGAVVVDVRLVVDVLPVDVPAISASACLLAVCAAAVESTPDFSV